MTPSRKDGEPLSVEEVEAEMRTAISTSPTSAAKPLRSPLMPDQITILDAAVETKPLDQKAWEHAIGAECQGKSLWISIADSSMGIMEAVVLVKEYTAALPHILPTGEGVRVKELEWREFLSVDLRAGVAARADSILGTSYAYGDGSWSGARSFSVDRKGSLETAKAAAQADLDQCIRSALVPAPPTEAVKPVAWRCFHCDEVFTDRSVAEDHFGLSEQQLPACVIKAGAERSLVRALRNAEQAASDAMFMLHNETSDAAKAYFAQTARHNAALQAAEEAGYERGLTNARPDPLPPTEAVKPEPVAWKTPYFEKLINGSLAPILVWGDLKGGDDWIALYATPPPAADVAELMEATHRLLALCKAGGDPYGEPGKPHVIAVEQALASLRSKGGGNG